MDTFTDSKTVKSFLTNLLSLFGLKQDCEIFPKQTQLTKDSETGQLRPGQFINLPYLGGIVKALNRWYNVYFGPVYESHRANLVDKERLKGITEEIEQQKYGRCRRRI